MLSLKAEKNHILLLRKFIPVMTGCRVNCTECCGPVLWSRWEWGHLKDKRPNNGTMNCPYAEHGLCQIYPERPIICRLFGIDGMPPNCQCSHQDGLSTMWKNQAMDIVERRRRTREIFMRYHNIIKETGTYGPFADLTQRVEELAEKNIGRRASIL